MSDIDSQTAYWDAAACTKRFTHPLHAPWLDGISTSATIVDYGCGYGRTMEILEQQGFHNLSGVDTSPGMIAQARRLHPTDALHGAGHRRRWPARTRASTWSCSSRC